MATITEDYVSFEIAKLLKDKGFDVPLWFYYDQNEEIMLASWSGWEEDWNNCFINNKPSPFISAPTHQMAMKWLREIYNIFIEISTSIDLNGKYHFGYTILDNKCKYIRKGYTCFDWNYKEAVEAALKYSLENLI